MRWVGGKSRYLDRIEAVLPNEITGYYEPFVGGGSVLIHVLESGRLCSNAPVRVNDANRHLIDFYNAVKDDPEGLIAELKQLVVSKEEFHVNRDKFNTKSTPALFLYLNKVGFRGLFRTNKNGKYNVPYGTNSFSKDKPFFFADVIRRCSQLFNKYGVVFSAGDYAPFLALHEESIPPHSVVVADPPYVPLNATSFQAYNADGFSPKRSQDVMLRMIQLSQRGHHVVYFNHNDPDVCAQFKDWEVEVFTARRTIRPTDASATAEEVMIFKPLARRA